MKIPIELPNPPMGFKAEAFIVANRKAERGEWVLLNAWDAVYTDENFEDLHRPILQLQKIEAPKPVIKATGIKQWEPPIVTFECTCGAKDDIEVAALKEQAKSCCGNLLVTYGPEVIAEAERQAKIEVLKEVLADDSCDTCHWYGVITEMLEQLEASK